MKLLVPVDGSENALRALRYAIDLLQKLRAGGTITLLNVHDDTALRHASRYVGRQAVDDYLADLSKADTADAVELLGAAGLPVDAQHRVGPVAEEIVRFASEFGYDLIVLGAKGRSSLRDLLVGSVAHKVSNIASTAVLIVR
ncbi:MAG: universal stress protein [Burkholderiales bacterium]|nr:MAG: universal stress protein [Burkholderiales bacterium]